MRSICGQGFRYSDLYIYMVYLKKHPNKSRSASPSPKRGFKRIAKASETKLPAQKPAIFSFMSNHKKIFILLFAIILLTALPYFLISKNVFGLGKLLGVKQSAKPSSILDRKDVDGAGENWVQVKNPDGSYTLEAHQTPINYENEKTGKFERIDVKLVPSDDKEYDFKNDRNLYAIYFKKNPKGQFIKIQYEKNKWLSFGLLPDDKFNTGSEAVVKNNSIVYPDIYPDMDLRYFVGKGTLIVEYVAKKPTSKSTYSQKIIQSGLELSEKDKTIEIKDKASKEVLAVMPAPRMYEERYTTGDTEKIPDDEIKNLASDKLHFELKDTKNGYLISKVIEQEGLEWLQKSERKYPVLIDLSTTKYVIAWADDAYDNRGGVWGDFDFYRIGASYDFLVRFQTIPIPKNSTITSAVFNYYNTYFNLFGAYIAGKLYLEVPGDADGYCNPFTGSWVNFAGQRPRSTAYTTIHSNQWTSSWPAWYSWNVATNVQELVNRSDWSTNMNMCFLGIHDDPPGPMNGAYANIRSIDYTGDTNESYVVINYTSPNGTACTANGDCTSSWCSPLDYDGAGKWCCNSNNGAHDGTCYASPACLNGYIVGNAGIWNSFSTNWTINTSCSLSSTVTTNPGNLSVTSGGALSLNNGANLRFTSTSQYIYVYSGGNIYIYSGGGFNR